MEILIVILLGSQVFSVWMGNLTYQELRQRWQKGMRAAAALLSVLAQAAISLALLAGAYYSFYLWISDDGQAGRFVAAIVLYVWVPASLIATLVGSLTLGAYLLKGELSRRRSRQFAGQ